MHVLRILLVLCLVASPLSHAAGKDAPREITVDLGPGVTMRLMLLPAGSFWMGSVENLGEEDESPRHRVTFSQPFYIGVCTVTQAQWIAVMGDNPSHFRGAQLPVDSVSWEDCQRFFTRLAARTGRQFALPTEAQWEYACRAGTETKWNFGESENAAPDHAWLRDNSSNTTHPVGQKPPNAWGLYDMHGNIAQWCADWYDKHTYDAGAVTDPTGPKTATGGRVLRGGAWGDAPEGIRAAARNCLGPDGKHAGIGFRCVMLLDAPEKAAGAAVLP